MTNLSIGFEISTGSFFGIAFDFNCKFHCNSANDGFNVSLSFCYENNINWGTRLNIRRRLIVILSRNYEFWSTHFISFPVHLLKSVVKGLVLLLTFFIYYQLFVFDMGEFVQVKMKQIEGYENLHIGEWWFFFVNLSDARIRLVSLLILLILVTTCRISSYVSLVMVSIP